MTSESPASTVRPSLCAAPGSGRTDTERLDWLQQNSAHLMQCGELEDIPVYWEVMTPRGSHTADTPRGAIDAAMDSPNDRTQARGAPEQQQTDRRNPASPEVIG
jgi:hypothetical protein